MPLLLLIALVTVGPASAESCECGPAPSACTRYWNATRFFTGRVVSVARNVDGDRRITFSVADTSTNIVVATGPAGRRCSLSFQTGHEYFVYARLGENGEWTTSVCLGTRAVEDAAADLEYARAIQEGTAPAGRIAGQVLTIPRDLARTPTGRAIPVPGVSVSLVKLADGTEQTAISDRAGDYAFAVTAAGRYAVRALVEDGRHYVEEHAATVDVRDPRACAYVERRVYSNGTVSGRIVDVGGRPIAGLTIDLKAAPIRTNPSRAETAVRRVTTDGAGRYEFALLPAGQFVVGINIDSTRQSKTVSLPRVLYPGVTNVTRATAIVVPDAGRIELKDWRLSSSVSYAPVSGVVIGVDGQPAANARVFLKGRGEGETILAGPVTTDFSGRFVIAGLANVGYRLFAERSQDDGQIRRLDSSDEVSVTATSAAAGVRLPLRHRY